MKCILHRCNLTCTKSIIFLLVNYVLKIKLYCTLLQTTENVFYCWYHSIMCFVYNNFFLTRHSSSVWDLLSSLQYSWNLVTWKTIGLGLQLTGWSYSVVCHAILCTAMRFTAISQHMCADNQRFYLAFLVTIKCTVCSYQITIWYVLYPGTIY